jgi:hypothetical protein
MKKRRRKEEEKVFTRSLPELIGWFLRSEEKRKRKTPE